jgi:hypothetical protein
MESRCTGFETVGQRLAQFQRIAFFLGDSLRVLHPLGERLGAKVTLDGLAKRCLGGAFSNRERRAQHGEQQQHVGAVSVPHVGAVSVPRFSIVRSRQGRRSYKLGWIRHGDHLFLGSLASTGSPRRQKISGSMTSS